MRTRRRHVGRAGLDEDVVGGADLLQRTDEPVERPRPHADSDEHGQRRRCRSSIELTDVDGSSVSREQMAVLHDDPLRQPRAASSRQTRPSDDIECLHPPRGYPGKPSGHEIRNGDAAARRDDQSDVPVCQQSPALRGSHERPRPAGSPRAHAPRSTRWPTSSSRVSGAATETQCDVMAIPPGAQRHHVEKHAAAARHEQDPLLSRRPPAKRNIGPGRCTSESAIVRRCTRTKTMISVTRVADPESRRDF